MLLMGSSARNPYVVNYNVERRDNDGCKDTHEGAGPVTMFQRNDKVIRLLDTQAGRGRMSRLTWHDSTGLRGIFVP
jgi:hypothetical protein